MKEPTNIKNKKNSEEKRENDFAENTQIGANETEKIIEFFRKIVEFSK